MQWRVRFQPQDIGFLKSHAYGSFANGVFIVSMNLLVQCWQERCGQRRGEQLGRQVLQDTLPSLSLHGRHWGFCNTLTKVIIVELKYNMHS